jgi:predicted transcriptional regulator
MDMMPIKPERLAQLEQYAQRQGQDPATALDDVLAAALDWEEREYRAAVEGIRRGHADLQAGRTRPASEFLDEMRQKYGLSR